MTNTVEEVYQAVSQLSEAEQETLMRMMIEQRSLQEQETGIMGDRELWLWQNPSALNSVLRGIEQAAAGEVHDLQLPAILRVNKLQEFVGAKHDRR